MVMDRQKAFDGISRSLAIFKYDLEHHQTINEHSLNIHGENFFRDIINYIYGWQLENANFSNSNMPKIDLINTEKKIAIQITSTRTVEKIKKTLEVLTRKEYRDYTVKIFYLLKKAKPNVSTINALNRTYKIDLTDLLLDSSDLIRAINNLEESRLIQLYEKYFKVVENSYTDNMVLNLVILQLIKQSREINKQYDDDFVTLDMQRKLELNNINSRIEGCIKFFSDYSVLLENLSEERLLTSLRKFVLNSYKSVLEEELRQKVENFRKNQKIKDLHQLAMDKRCDFNKIIHNLYNKIKNTSKIGDFNTINIPWIIIAYFFEVCDIGVRKS